jgi:Mn2+/Fe2+ NRAMP family transporter
MTKIFEIALGIVTSIGGFLEVGSMVTAAQAGAEYGFQLTWAIVLGGLCVTFLVEMSGRLAAVSHHTIPDALRERFGFPFFLIPLVTLTFVHWLVLAAELGGVCYALQLVTGIRFVWWAVPVGLVTWLLLWKGTFGLIEEGVSLLGLVTVAFVVAAVKLGTPAMEVARNALPSVPAHDPAHYWFVAVSILGASVTPYLMYFYSSGAIEDGWDEGHLGMNRIIAAGGMGFGSGISVAVLVVAALVLAPEGIHVDRLEQAALTLVEPLGRPGFYLFAASLGIACLGAALEVSLASAYLIAQGLGWNWSENPRPRNEARFALSYTVFLATGALLLLTGIDPLRLTVFAMALTAAVLPVATVPFLVLMNDEHYLREHTNGWFGNLVVAFVVLLASLLGVVTIPLEILGG